MNNRILKLDKFGNKLFEFGTFGSANSQFNQPIGILIYNGMMYIVDSMNHRIQVFGVKDGITYFKKIENNNLKGENKDIKELTKLEKVYTFPNPYGGNIQALVFKYKAAGFIQRVIVEVYNLAGRLIEKFEDSTIDGEIYWEGANRLSNGVYIYRITIIDSSGKSLSKVNKLVILK